MQVGGLEVVRVAALGGAGHRHLGELRRGARRRTPRSRGSTSFATGTGRYGAYCGLSISLSTAAASMPEQRCRGSPRAWPARRRELLAVDGERGDRHGLARARCRCGRRSCRAPRAPSTKRSRFCCAATASFSPPVTCRNHRRVSRPPKRAMTMTPITTSRRRLFASVTGGSAGRCRSGDRRSGSAARSQPSLADAPAPVAGARDHPRTRQVAAGIVAPGRPPHDREHRGRDQRVVDRRDDHDPQAVERQEPGLAHDGAGGEEHEPAEQPAEAAEDREPATASCARRRSGTPRPRSR